MLHFRLLYEHIRSHFVLRKLISIVKHLVIYVRRFEQLRGNIIFYIYNIYKYTPSFICSVKSNWCSKITNNKLTRKKSVINLSLLYRNKIDISLTPSAKRSILFLIEFILICAMVILLIFLTLNAFSLVVGSCSSDSQVAETGNDKLFFEVSSLHSGDS